MKFPGKNAAAAILLLACLLAGVAPAGAQTASETIASNKSLAAYGFDVSIDELFELLSFQRSARLDTQAKIEADWASRFEKLTLRDLEKSENR
jgi:hypothetical protein